MANKSELRRILTEEGEFVDIEGLGLFEQFENRLGRFYIQSNGFEDCGRPNLRIFEYSHEENIKDKTGLKYTEKYVAEVTNPDIKNEIQRDYCKMFDQLKEVYRNKYGKILNEKKN